MLSCELCGYPIDVTSYNMSMCCVCRKTISVCIYCAEKIIVGRVTKSNGMCVCCERDKKIGEVLGE
jgi:hypothetical protein